MRTASCSCGHAFADPTFPPPRVSVYGVRRHPWTGMPGLAIEELD